MSTLVAQTISNGTVSTSSANVIQGSAKAWVNFDGSGGSIRASYNVSSITVNGTGDYTANFTNAFADANYTVNVTPSGNNTNYRTYLNYIQAPATSNFRVLFNNATDTAQLNPTYVYCAVFR